MIDGRFDPVFYQSLLQSRAPAAEGSGDPDLLLAGRVGLSVLLIVAALLTGLCMALFA